MEEQKEMLVIDAQLRQDIGKSSCKKFRKKGLVPAIFCDKGNSTPIIVEAKQLLKLYKAKEDRTCVLKLDNMNKEVLIKEVQIEPIRRTLLHVDFVSKQ